MSGDLHHDVRLEEAQEMSITHDIRVFYEDQFSKIRDASSLQVDELPVQWPGNKNIRLLVDKAVPLFIFAFTICRYIAASPERNLNTILNQSPGKSLPGLKGTYVPILNSVVVSEGDGEEGDRILDFKRIAGTVVLLHDLATHLTLTTTPRSTLLLEASWIKLRGVDFLWLPHEYRGGCNDVHGSHLVIGHVSGAVSFFWFK
jgi:hypothetical protein